MHLWWVKEASFKNIKNSNRPVMNSLNVRSQSFRAELFSDSLLPPLYHFHGGSWSGWGICVRPWSILSEPGPGIRPQSCSEGHTSPAPDCRPHSSCLDPPALRKHRAKTLDDWQYTPALKLKCEQRMRGVSSPSRGGFSVPLLCTHVVNRFLQW